MILRLRLLSMDQTMPLKHVLTDLGWVSKDAKWGGKDYKRVLWLKPGYTLKGGTLSGPET